MRNRSIRMRSRNRRGLGVARAVVCWVVCAAVEVLLWAVVRVIVVSEVWDVWWERVVDSRPFRVIRGRGLPRGSGGSVIWMESTVRRVSAVRSRI